MLSRILRLVSLSIELARYAEVLKKNLTVGGVINYVVERGGWSIYQDGVNTCEALQSMGLTARVCTFDIGLRNSIVHYGSVNVFANLYNPNKHDSNKYFVNVFHGSSGMDPKIIPAIDKLIKHQHDMSGIFCTNETMRAFLIQKGMDESKLFHLPIGYSPTNYTFANRSQRISAKIKLGLPLDVPIIASFQKDGNGWVDGNTPKLVKGPDLLLDALRKVYSKHEFFVLLSGPSRGFVLNGLKAENIPFKYLNIAPSNKMSELYAAADFYLIPSRDEGGPKAVLEAVACGTPVISTDVGIAKEVLSNVDGCLVVKCGSADALSAALSKCLLCFEGPHASAFNQQSVEKVLENFTWQKVAERCNWAYQMVS